MFQFPGLPLLPYVFRQEYARITTRGFPHSEIPGSKVGQHLPRAYRSRPRPSSALGAKASTVCSCSLDRKEHVNAAMEFSRCARARPSSSRTARKRSLKTQQREVTEVVIAEVDVLLGDSNDPDESRQLPATSTGSRAPGVKSSGFPRKEVIQPHLPVRLPCYDFTPIINPTFDGCLPEG
jgi:hypothetical protein